MKRYWTLLRDEPLLRRLSIIQLIAYFGAWFSNVAIYTLLIQLHVSATTIAFVAALHFFAGVLQAPLSGVMIDRFSPKKLMILLTLTEITATLGLLFIHDISQLIWLYGLVFIRMGAASFQFTVEMSLLPRVLEGKALQYANEIHSVIWSFSYTAGMALGGAVVYYIGTKYAFLLDASLFVIVLMLLFSLTIHVNIEKQHQSFLSMMGDAFRYIRHNKIVLHLMLLHAVVGFTAFDALVVLSVKQYYMDVIAVSLGIGLVHASRAIGLTFGPLFLGEWVNIHRLQYLFIAEGLSIVLWAFVIEHFYLSLAASILVGFVTTTLWSYSYTLLQHHTQSDYYGRIVAYNDMVFLMVGGVVSMVIGFLVDIHVSLAMITILLGSAFFVAAFYYRWIRVHYTLSEIGNQ
jgi:MFS transporter, DHA3 family, macrolide efflux protein